MRVEDLHHSELLELDPEGGVIRFAGQRADGADDPIWVKTIDMCNVARYNVKRFNGLRSVDVDSEF